MTMISEEQIPTAQVRELMQAYWFNFDGLEAHFKDLTTPLLGDYQVDNAAVAIAAYLTYHQATQLPVVTSDVKAAVAATQWPGRFER
ncbi:hypothetical protein WP50_26160, partial [Lactiplantibacillus plantarum]